jgi:hypothetical protein
VSEVLRGVKDTKVTIVTSGHEKSEQHAMSGMKVGSDTEHTQGYGTKRPRPMYREGSLRCVEGGAVIRHTRYREFLPNKRGIKCCPEDGYR